MSDTRYSEEVARIREKFFAHNPVVVTAAIRRHKVVTDTVGRVWASFSVTDPTPDEIRLAVSNAIPEGVSPVDGTFYPVDDATITGLIRRDTKVRALSEDRKHYKELSSNVLMDDTDQSIWEIRALEGKSYLVRVEEESLDDILASIPTTDDSGWNPKGASDLREAASTMEIPDAEYPLVNYYDPMQHAVRGAMLVKAGDGMASLYNWEEDATVEVPSALLVSLTSVTPKKTDLGQFTKPKEGTPTTNADLTEYYRKWFKYAPEYFEQMRQDVLEREKVA